MSTRWRTLCLDWKRPGEGPRKLSPSQMAGSLGTVLTTCGESGCYPEDRAGRHRLNTAGEPTPQGTRSSHPRALGRNVPLISCRDHSHGKLRCNHSTWEVEAGGSGVQSHPQVHQKFQAILGYMRLGVQKGREDLGADRHHR